MEATVARSLSGLDPADLQGGDQEVLAELIATYFDDREALEGNQSWSTVIIATPTV